MISSAKRMTTEPLTPAIVRTKLYRPPLPPDWVPRPQLLEHLQRQRQRPLTLFSAPAGYGKSTLLSAWLEACDWPSAWLSLDESDNDLATFLSYIVSAVQTVFPEFGQDIQALLKAVSLPPLAAIVENLSNDLDEINEPFLLALDDYHVIHNPAIHSLLSDLLNHPPHDVHLILAARHDPPLPLTRLRARAALSEIRSQDLRFSLEETLTFLRRALNPQLDETRAALFKERTEGWAAGLRLAALSAWRANSEAKLAQLDSSNAYLVDYLTSEVLVQQPTALQEFLLKTSILERLNGSLCEAVAQPGDRVTAGQTYLARLEELNLFIVPLDDQREWFRFHHVFQQLLQQQLKRRYPQSEIDELHDRASHWFATHGLLEEAVQHALLADNTAAAAHIVARQRHELMNQDEWRHLELLLHALPRRIVESHPELLLATAWSEYNRYNLLEVPDLINRAATLVWQRTGEPSTAQDLQGEVEFFRGYQAFWADDLLGVIAHMQLALQWIPLDGWHARVLACLFLATAYHMLGDSEQAAVTLAAGLTEARTNAPYRMRMHLITCFVYWLAGDLQRAADAASQVLALADQRLDYPQTIHWARYFSGIVHYQRNQLDLAEQALSAMVLDRYQTHMQCLVHGAIALAFTYQAQQRPIRARIVADMLPDFLHEMGNTALLPTIHAFQADLALRQGRLAEASQWAAQTQPTAFSLMPHFFGQSLVWPKVLLALDTPDNRQTAAAQLARLREFAESRQHIHILIETLAVQALLYESQGEHSTAQATLNRALELAQPGGFMRLFIDLGQPMQGLARQLRDRGAAPNFVEQILAAFTVPSATPPAALRDSAELIEPLTRRELEVLALLAERLSNKEIATNLFITPNTVKQHTLHLYQKLQVSTRHEAVTKAQSLGLLNGR